MKMNQIKQPDDQVNRHRLLLLSLGVLAVVAVLWIVSANLAARPLHLASQVFMPADNSSSAMAAFTSTPSPVSSQGQVSANADQSEVYLPLVAMTNPTSTPSPTSAPSATPPVAPTSSAMLFQDEFNGASLDTSKWNTEYPWGPTHDDNNELECYTPESLIFSSGILRLQATEQSIQCHDVWSSPATYPYRSGMITSHGKFSFQYGYIEMRARLPKGKGLWPTFWLLKEVQPPAIEAWPPEVDIVEVLGHEPNKVYMTNWWGTESSPHSDQYTYTGPDMSLAYHTYAIDWQAGRITWYIDGVKRAEVTQHVPSTAMYIIANLAVGGDWPGSPDSSTQFPANFDIDYIRVYRQKP